MVSLIHHDQLHNRASFLCLARATRRLDLACNNGTAKGRLLKYPRFVVIGILVTEMQNVQYSMTSLQLTETGDSEGYESQQRQKDERYEQ